MYLLTTKYQVCISLREIVVERADEGDARGQLQWPEEQIETMYYSCYETRRRHERDMHVWQ